MVDKIGDEDIRVEITNEYIGEVKDSCIEVDVDGKKEEVNVDIVDNYIGEIKDNTIEVELKVADLYSTQKRIAEGILNTLTDSDTITLTYDPQTETIKPEVNIDVVTESVREDLNSHIQDTSIHFTQEEIAIPHTKITDWETQFNIDFDNAFTNKTTDDLQEGATNKYDKVVTFTGGSNITITGSYPNFTINDNTAGIDDLNNHINNSNNPHLTSLSKLTDVEITTPSIGEGLVFNGSQWVNQGVVSQVDFDSHVNNTDIHFTQSEINIESSQISDFDEAISSNPDVSANTLARHTHDNKGYLDVIDQNLDTSSQPTFNQITINNYPTNFTDAATKEYVDIAVSSLGLNYYLTDNDSGVEDYKDASLIDPDGNEVSIVKSGLSDGDYIIGWITPLEDTPPKLCAGVYELRIEAEKISGNKEVQLYWELVERKVDNTEVVIGTSVTSADINSRTGLLLGLTLQSEYELSPGSRVVAKVRVHVTGSGNDPTLAIYYQGATGANWSLPANTEVLMNLYVPYSGAVKDVDLGTHNLTTTGTVSATNININGNDFDTAVSLNSDVSANTAHRNATNNPHQTSIENLTDTSISNLTSGQGLVYDGSNWVNVDIATQSELDAHTSDTSNPHNVTASQVGAYSKSEADSRFVNVSGDTITGVLTVEDDCYVNGNFFVDGVIKEGAFLAPNLIKNSYMNILDGNKPAGFSSVGVTIEAVHPFTKAFEGPYTAEKPENAVDDPELATESTPYWFGRYNKGPRIKRGGLADGWHSLGDGHILKITGSGLTPGVDHSYVILPFERNILGTEFYCTAWVKIVKGSKVGIGGDSGYKGIARGIVVDKATADTGEQGWYRLSGIATTSQITSLDGLAMSFGVEADENGEVEVYLALPYIGNLTKTGTNKETWMPSIADTLSRDGLTIHPTEKYLGINLGNNLPDRELHIKETSSDNSSGIRIENADNSRNMRLWVGTGGAVIDAYSGANLHIQTEGTDRIVIDNATGVADFKVAPTVNGNTIWHAGNDGSGSGLDADLLDGLHASSFLRSDANNSTDVYIGDGYQITIGSGSKRIDGEGIELYGSTSSAFLSVQDGNGRIQLKWNATYGTSETYVVSSEPAARWEFDPYTSSNQLFAIYYGSGGNAGDTISWQTILEVGTSTFKYKDYTIWHEGNDGSGSGLDADKLDGYHASDFVYRKVKSITPSSAGWYRFAYGQGNCSYNGALFKIRYTKSGKHGVILFWAGITYGQYPVLNIISRTAYGDGSGITQIRLLYKGTYDQPYLEFYVNDSGVSIEVEMLNNSNSGWTLQDIASGSVPSGYYSKTITVTDKYNSFANDSLVVKDNETVYIKRTAYFDSEYDNGSANGSKTIDWNTRQKQKVTLTGDVTLSFTNPPGPCNLVLKIVQDSTGGHSVTFPSNVKWENGLTPDLSGDDGNSVRIVTLYFDGSNYYAQITKPY